MVATEAQRGALHKFGVRELDPELTKDQASKLLDALVGLSRNGNRGKLKALVEELNTPGLLQDRLDELREAQPDAKVGREEVVRKDSVEVEQAAEDYVVKALLEARHAFMVVFPELSTEAIAPLALSLCQSILKDVRSEKINGGAKRS